MELAELATLAVLAAVVVGLAREVAPPPAVLLAAVVGLLLLGVVDADVAFAGFSNPATLTVAALFIVARAVHEHGGLAELVARVLEGGRGQAPLVDRAADRPETGAVARMSASVALMSSVIANTPLVATLAPIVRGWSERHGLAASRLLMPLSFATILGGLLTTIGTSTTLVVSGLVAESGFEALDLFEILPVGLPVALVGVVILIWWAPRVLPDRRSPHEQVTTHERDYTFRVLVRPTGPYDGRSVGAAGLRNLEGVYLVQVERSDREIAPVPPDTRLLGGDVLTFVGGVDTVRDLLDRDGLDPSPDTQTHLLDGARHGMFECVLGASSPMIGRTLKQVSFRGRYGGAVLAIHRAGARVEGKLGDVELRPGDALLVIGDRRFDDRWRDRHDFAVIVPLDTRAPASPRRRALVLTVMLAMVVAAGLGVPLLTAVLAACAVIVGTRTLSFWEARTAVDIDVVLIIAAAIGLGGAVTASGLADRIATAIAAVSGVAGYVGALAAVLVGTLVLTELITNVAAAALMVPIAIGVAQRLDVDPIGFAIAVAVAASSSFLTPVGYQTNTIVYGLGGYRFGDYWRLGLPITIAVAVTSLVVIPLVWG